MQILALKWQHMQLLTCLAMITAINAASLGLKPVKQVRSDFKGIQCKGKLPKEIPSDLPRWYNLLDMCSSTGSVHAANLRCYCFGPQMICGATATLVVDELIDYCFTHCNCGPGTYRLVSGFTVNLDNLLYLSPIAEHDPNAPVPQHHTCSGSCTTASRGCAWAYTGDCSCHAPPVGLFFWFKGVCETRFINPTSGGHGKRELSPSTRFDSRNSNKRQVMDPSHVDHSSNSTMTASQSQTSLVDKSAPKYHPAPCNESYVSYACHDAVDGIVHEPPENWLGALLPENAAENPPVPAHWLKIHGFEDLTASGGVKVEVMRPANEVAHG